MNISGKENTKSPSSVDNAFSLITILAQTRQPMTIMEISRALGISRTTAYALVSILIKHHCLERVVSSKKYALGHRFYEIGTSYRYQFPFLPTAEKHMMPVFQNRRLRMNLWVIKEPAVAVILLSLNDSLIPYIPHGYVVPAHATASGKLLMAFSPPETIKRWLNGMVFQKLTDKTITGKYVLEEQLAQISKQGYSVEDGELNIGRACIAAPVRDKTGEVVAAVSFAGGHDEIFDSFTDLKQEICSLGQIISADLGFNPLHLSGR